MIRWLEFPIFAKIKAMKINILFIILLVTTVCNAQPCSGESSLAYQQQLNTEYADAEKSPLTEADLKTFKALEFYAVYSKFCIEAKLVRTPKEKPFYMATSTERKPRYKKYGELHFTIDGKQLKLDVYQSLDLIKLDEYKNNLFLPFTDLTSGNGSYGGGRYLDLTIPEGDTLILDFNKAYNPYCAYNHKYSCPLVPKQNDLNVAIEAGVKEYLKS